MSVHILLCQAYQMIMRTRHRVIAPLVCMPRVEFMTDFIAFSELSVIMSNTGLRIDNL